MFFLQILLTSLVTGTQVLLLAAGLYAIYSLTRIFHITLGVTSAAGGYGFYALHSAGLPFAASFAGGLLTAASIGIISYFILQPFIKSGHGLLGLIASLALGTIIESTIAIAFGSDGKFLTDSILPTFYFGDLRITQVGLAIIVIGIAIALVSYIVLRFLPHGRSLRALAQHNECASVIGISPRAVRMAVFVLTGLVAGLIGILTGMNNAITPFFGFEPITMAFIALLVGGVTDFRGIVVASYVLALIPEIIIAANIGGLSFSAAWKMVFAFALALCLLLLRPNGLFRTVTRAS